MNDAELDEQLSRGTRQWSSRVTATIDELIVSTRDADSELPHQPKSRHRGLVIGSVLGAAFVITAGASITAVQLGLPPFQTIDPGVERLTTPIPLDYVEETGNAVHCDAFLEFENLDSPTQSRLEEQVRDHDWTAIAQPAYDGTRSDPADQPRDDSNFSNRLRDEFFTHTQQFVPQLIDGPSDAAGIVFSGYGMSCTPQNR